MFYLLHGAVVVSLDIRGEIWALRKLEEVEKWGSWSEVWTCQSYSVQAKKQKQKPRDELKKVHEPLCKKHESWENKHDRQLDI